MPSDAHRNDGPQFVDAFELRQVGRALKRHGLIVLLCALIAGAVGVTWSLLSPRLYRAEAVILVNIQSVRIGADGIPMDVELIPPARRTVGTICQSDAVMLLLSARLAGEPDPAWPSDAKLQQMITVEGQKEARTRPVRDLHQEVYFDQLSQEMAALRAVANEPDEAARIANVWAGVCREMLVRAYGTTRPEIEQQRARAEAVMSAVVQGREQLAKLDPDNEPEAHLKAATELDLQEKTLEEINRRVAQLTVRMDDSQSIARVTSEAAPPMHPINASVGLVGGLFGLAGLLLGLAVALLRVPRAV